MVNILRHAPSSPVVDEQAMQTFRRQWQVYSKLVTNDCLSHRAAGEVLHRELVAVNRPFRFLDLACGDAAMTVAALRDTPVIHYHGIDLLAPALDLARACGEAPLVTNVPLPEAPPESDTAPKDLLDTWRRGHWILSRWPVSKSLFVRGDIEYRRVKVDFEGSGALTMEWGVWDVVDSAISGTAQLGVHF